MSIMINCPSCGTGLRVRDEAAGKRASCPKCKVKIRIPSSDSLNAQDPSPPPAMAQPAPIQIHPANYDETEHVENQFNEAGAENEPVRPRRFRFSDLTAETPATVVEMNSVDKVLAIIRFLIWGAFLLYLLLIVYAYNHDMNSANNILQQNEIAAANLFWIVAGYAGARALDSMLRPKR
jgi:hypothetical protein